MRAYVTASLLAVPILALMAATALAGPRNAVPSWRAGAEVCRYYGFPRHTRAFSACILNVRHYWSTGPCSDWSFAAVHKRYCNNIPEADF
jgi:hypothetical protein